MLRSLVGSEMCIRDSLLTILRSLKFTSHVPVMCTIGDTFSNAMKPTMLFLFAIVVLFLGFGVSFNVIFSTDLDAFSRLDVTLFSMFRGLSGDIDADSISDVQPVIGPLIFSLFLTVVLFVAFTILIAIVSDAYDVAKERKPQKGLLLELSQKLDELLGNESAEENQPKPGEQGCGPRELGELAQQIEERFVQLMDVSNEQQRELLTRIDRLEQQIHDQNSASPPLDLQAPQNDTHSLRVIGWDLGPPESLSLIHISEPTRLLSISYAVFCLKKKKTKSINTHS
eukprot:TRINITY_DN11213_c0_g1_i1.p1 TRINITY_DN11213_c0_g1~~TRINITY_DN11213_c0_g1_i1.p1  ORF type:complete len:284 (+),score=82.00 TRINITY_DN11213_c0_g1_i1:95-946(+)